MVGVVAVLTSIPASESLPSQVAEPSPAGFGYFHNDLRLRIVLGAENDEWAH